MTNREIADQLEKVSQEVHRLADLLRQTPETSQPPAPESPPVEELPSLDLDTRLYVDPYTLAASNGHARLASIPQAVWVLGPQSIPDVQRVAEDALQRRQIAQFVLYWIPGRDNNSESSGGAPNSETYRQFIEDFVQAITPLGINGLHPIVTVEPDAVTLSHDGTPSERFDDLRFAGSSLLPFARAFLDLGHSNWLSVGEAARRFDLVDEARNFEGAAFNTSNVRPMSELVPYAEEFSRITGRPYILDTSRNGVSEVPANEEWNNQQNRKFGPLPRLSPQVGPNCYAYVWNKRPGESDGSGQGGPPPGKWFEKYARDIEQRSWGT